MLPFAKGCIVQGGREEMHQHAAVDCGGGTGNAASPGMKPSLNLTTIPSMERKVAATTWQHPEPKQMPAIEVQTNTIRRLLYTRMFENGKRPRLHTHAHNSTARARVSLHPLQQDPFPHSIPPACLASPASAPRDIMSADRPVTSVMLQWCSCRALLQGARLRRAPRTAAGCAF